MLVLVQKRQLRELLARFYPEKQPEETDDPAMELHLRLLLEKADDELDRYWTARHNERR
jgi:hypothetical protein